LPGTDRVKQSADQYGQFFFVEIGKGLKLIQGFGTRIGPPSFFDRPHDPVVIFRQIMLHMFAVNLGGRRNKHLFLKLIGQPQDHFGSFDVGIQCFHRMVHDVSDTYRSRQMVYLVCFEYQLVHDGFV